MNKLKLAVRQFEHDCRMYCILSRQHSELDGISYKTIAPIYDEGSLMLWWVHNATNSFIRGTAE